MAILGPKAGVSCRNRGLKAAGNKPSPEWTLELRRQLLRRRAHLLDEQTVTGLSTLSAEQAQLFTPLKLPKPTTKNI